MIKIVPVFLLLAVVLHSCEEALPEKGESSSVRVDKCLRGLESGVACAHPAAALVGAEVLAKGGNAMDAAIAMQWALAVCFPEAGNIGGGGLMVARMSNGEAYTLDYRESAPAAAHRDFFLDSLKEVVAGKSTETKYAAGIPGTVHGLFTAHERFGKLPMNELIDPAIALAANGFSLTANQANNLNKNREIFVSRNPAGTAFIASNGQWNAGDTLVQSELAATLTRIRDGGLRAFYAGTTARMIVDDMPTTAPWMTAEDLAQYTSIWRKPVYCNFDSVQIISMPPPSSGGIALCQLLELFNSTRTDTLRHNSAEYLHRLVEMERRVYADRSVHLGDPDHYSVPQGGLLRRDYIRSRFADFNPTKATPSSEVRAGIPLTESMETTHLSVVDAEGNAVAVTTTLNDIYGSKIVVKGAGFLLNNEIDDFSLKPGAPNMYGLIGGEANAVAPGKRMLSSMTPTIVLIDGKLFLVAGSPGGSTIITSVFQTVVNAVYYNMPLDEVIAAPKFHSQWLPDVVFLEKARFDSTVVHKLEQLGHEMRYLETLGRVDAIMAMPDGKLDACGDVRSDNAAGGY